jgi:predicted DNA-binding protein with PD1-like motif
MRYCETNEKRVFIIRLEDGEIIQDSIERFAVAKNIHYARIQLLGGIDKGSVLIVGPKESRSAVIEPIKYTIHDMHEAVGNGTIFPDEQGTPRLHCHLACGRESTTVCGEIREGVKVWHVMEVVITEFENCNAIRRLDKTIGFDLLYPGSKF